ncbi:hypothetical protein GWI33_009887, partial [Rhynchophorus ferrugineus]
KQSIERVFISIPRFSVGAIPATFGIVSKTVRDGNNLLKPYPSWSWHVNLEQCNFYRLVSVFRTWVDECNRLWVLDSGVVGDDQWCPPQILIFNADTDELLHKYEVPFDIHRNRTTYVTPAVELETIGNVSICEKAWLYGADVNGSLLVYSLEQNQAWSYRHPSFNYNENYTTMVIEGLSFSFNDGVLGLALSPVFNGKSRRLYYHSLNGNTENWVYTDYLRNRVNDSQIFNTLPNERGEQSAPQAFDKWGNLYFSLINSVEVVSWNIKYPYRRKFWKIIGNNQKTMQFPSGLKVSLGKQGQEQLWIFATSIQRYATGNLNNSQINFRLFYRDL